MIERNAETTVRPAEREAFCRWCDGTIHKGENMVSFYSWRNRGQNIHFHIDCVKQMATFIETVNESK